LTVSLGAGGSLKVSQASLSAPVVLTALAGAPVVTVNGQQFTLQLGQSLATDKTPPVTTATPNPGPNANGWNKTDVTVTLTATDPTGTPNAVILASGVKEVHHSVNGGPEVVSPGATASLTLTAEGMHAITYFAVDNAGNREAAKTLTVRIDRTPPEAYNQFDPATKNVLVFGRDSRSGVPPGPVAPASVVSVKWGDNDDHDGKKDGKDKDDEKGNAELRTYRITDAAGNTLVLVEKVKKEGREIKAKIVSLQYNGGAVITPPENKKSFEWSLNKDGTLKELEQKLEIGKGKDKQVVKAKFEAEKNQTVIRQGPDAEEDDDGKGVKVVKPGLVLLRLASDKGKLVIEF
jgi:hypothetical protein